MKQIVLLRHAKSSWDAPYSSDSERKLNERGKRDAPFMAKVLKKRDFIPDVIVSSPARRARVTAQHIASGLRYPLEDIIIQPDLYLGNNQAFLRCIHQLNNSHSSAILTGHNPAITDVIKFLGGESGHYMPTCAMICIAFDSNNWNTISLPGTIMWFEYPKKYYEDNIGPLNELL
jgi:phosphohistidine phosphatase